MPETEAQTGPKEQLAVAGEQIEARILGETEPQPFLSESERLELRTILAENGVNFKPFQTGIAFHLESGEKLEMKDGTHASKFAMVTACLSREKFRRLVLSSLEQAIQQSGGAVIKVGAEKQFSDQEVLNFARGYLDKQFGRKTRPKFSPRTQGSRWGVEIDEDTATNVIYRIEAITASAYILLRTLSFDADNAETAAKFQTGTVANKQLRERMIRGKARSYPKGSPEREQWEVRQSDEKIVRHLPPKTLGTVARNFYGWA